MEIVKTMNMQAALIATRRTIPPTPAPHAIRITTPETKAMLLDDFRVLLKFPR